MKCRSLLVTVAVASFLVCLGVMVVNPKPQWEPPPMWEWGVGEWKNGAREWTAEADVADCGFHKFWRSYHVNSDKFCGAAPGCLKVLWSRSECLPYGSVRLTVALLERKLPHSQFQYTAWNGEKWVTTAHTSREGISFAELFPGGQAVDSE